MYQQQITFMNRITNLLLLLVLSATALAAQTVSGNVLLSWSDATGAIRIPDEVTEIAANCFYTPDEDNPNGWGDVYKRQTSSIVKSWRPSR